MRIIALAFILSAFVARADSTKITVLIAGRVHTGSEVERLVIAHASRASMQFDFGGVQPHLIAQSNGPAVVTIWCAQTNEAFFHATIDRNGRISAQELSSQDSRVIRSMLARQTSNAVTQVWLGPDGRVGAATVRAGREDGEIFWLRRVRGGWTIGNRMTWKKGPPPTPTIPVRDNIYTG